MKYKLKVYSIWEFGQRKDSQGNPHQEDSMFPEYGKQSDDDRLFILCDGMGGHDAGEVASATVCEAMSDSILNDGHDKEGVFTSEDFSDALNAAFDALDKKDSGAEKKMGTTMTFLKLHDKGAFIAHMGDSRVYQIRSGKTGEETQIVFQTEDHSLVNDLIKIGELTKEEARFSKQKNVITRAMQPNMEHRPKADIHETSDIKAGDYFYMCSDGMLEQAEMEDGESLRNIFSEMGGNDENKVEILKSVTEKNRDNHTAFIIHILEVEDPIEDTIKENTSMPAVDDKFTAIVEEDVNDNDSLSEIETTEQTTNQTTPAIPSESNMPVANNVDEEKEINSSSKALTKEDEKVLSKESGSKSLKTNVIRFLVAAIAVLVVILGFSYFRICSKGKSNEGKVKMELPSGTRSSPNSSHNKPPLRSSNIDSNTAETGPSAQAAVEVANSSAASQLEVSDSPSNNESSSNLSIQLPPYNSQTDGVVNSDEQIVINNSIINK